MRFLFAVLLCGSTALAEDAGLPPPASGCREAIGEENAQKLFAALKDVKDDDCALEEMKTEGEVMRVEWRKAGTPIPLVEIHPIACAKGTVNGPAFSLTIPPGAAEKCPKAMEKMSQLIATQSFGGSVKIDDDQRDSIWVYLGGAGLVLIVVFLIWRRREAT
jgi:hypothetical protein